MGNQKMLLAVHSKRSDSVEFKKAIIQFVQERYGEQVNLGRLGFRRRT
jgi:hypothetical protein